MVPAKSMLLTSCDPKRAVGGGRRGHAAVEAGKHLGGDGLDVRTLLEDGERIVEGERLAGALLGAEAADADADVEAINEKRVRAP